MGMLVVNARKAVVTALVGLPAATAFGQDSTSGSPANAEITITVTDPTGALIVHADVTFKGEATATAQTGEDGSVRLTVPYKIMQ
jgi:hypothetical protein